MKTIKKINQFALIICFLFYLTCYLRFAGQVVLAIIQLVTAIYLTFEIFSKPNYDEIKKQIKDYWLIMLLNAVILFTFFERIMWNDFFQVVFVTLIPNLAAIYFYRILIQYENVSITK